MQKYKKFFPWLLLFIPLIVALVGANSFFPRPDSIYILNWYFTLLLYSLTVWPLTASLIRRGDHGYAAAKILFAVLMTVLIFWSSTLGLVPFSQSGIMLQALLLAIVCYSCFPTGRKLILNLNQNPALIQRLVLIETVFVLLLLFWCFARGLKPEIDGMEKVMDYGFIKTLEHSFYLPAKDMWWANGNINYYYGGHLLITLWGKLSSVQSTVYYNLGVATTFAISASLLFAGGMNFSARYFSNKKTYIFFGGLLPALLVTVGGNGHAFFYSEHSPLSAWMKTLAVKYGHIVGQVNDYWFPNATRYIGHNPASESLTIHEFPFYSFLVADLHAHLLNLMVVLLLVYLLLSLNLRFFKQSLLGDTKLVLRQPLLYLLGIILAFFMLANFWDFIIYFSLLSLLLLALCYKSLWDSFSIAAGGIYLLLLALVGLVFLSVTQPLLAVFCYGLIATSMYFAALKFPSAWLKVGFASAALFALAYWFALPFNYHFEMMSKGIGLVPKHSALFQLVVVWSLMLVAALTAVLSLGYLNKNNSLFRALLFSLAFFAIFLLVVPEIIYVKDIYAGKHLRANTMFKFTYQAFVLLMLLWGLGTVGLLARPERWAKNTAIGLLCLLYIPLLYPYHASKQWLGSFEMARYQSLDGAEFIKHKQSPQINNQHVANRLNVYLPVIEYLNLYNRQQQTLLETFGEGYTDYNLVSAFSGSPTILGWNGHERLWRSSPQYPDPWLQRIYPREQEVTKFYQENNPGYRAQIIAKYSIRYIVIGPLEQTRHPVLADTSGAVYQSLLALGEAVINRDGVVLLKLPQ